MSTVTVKKPITSIQTHWSGRANKKQRIKLGGRKIKNE